MPAQSTDAPPARPAVLFVTSNGAGLGHLTRMMAVARRLPDGYQSVFATMSKGLPLLEREGYRSEYLPTPQRLQLPVVPWNRYLAIRMRQLIDQYDPRAVILDATLPFEGLAQAFQSRPNRVYVWCRRAMWKRGLGAASVARSDLFDLVIEPGEAAAALDVGETLTQYDEVLRLDPMVLHRESEILGREAAREELGLPEQGTCVLVQLGAGNINDLDSDFALTLHALREQAPDAAVVVSQSVIADRLVELPPEVRTVRAFPLSRLYRGFDFVVSAAGYNSFHELLDLGIPTVFLPNLHTRLDEQVARARFAQECGIGLCVEAPSSETLRTAVVSMLDRERRGEMVRRLGAWSHANGAAQAAGTIVTLIEEDAG